MELGVNHDKPTRVRCSWLTVGDVMDLLAIFPIRDLPAFLARQIAKSKITSHQPSMEESACLQSGVEPNDCHGEDELDDRATVTTQ